MKTTKNAKNTVLIIAGVCLLALALLSAGYAAFSAFRARSQEMTADRSSLRKVNSRPEKGKPLQRETSLRMTLMVSAQIVEVSRGACPDAGALASHGG